MLIHFQFLKTNNKDVLMPWCLPYRVSSTGSLCSYTAVNMAWRLRTSPKSFIASPTLTHDCGYGQPRRLRSSFHQHVLPPSAIAPFLSSPLVSGTDCHLTLRRPRHCLHSRDASRLNCLHEAIPIAPATSDFPFRLLVDAVTHVFSVFRVCKVP